MYSQSCLDLGHARDERAKRPSLLVFHLVGSEASNGHPQAFATRSNCDLEPTTNTAFAYADAVCASLTEFRTLNHPRPGVVSIPRTYNDLLLFTQ